MASYAARLRAMRRASDPRLRPLAGSRALLALVEIAGLFDAGTSGRAPKHNSPTFNMSLDALAQRLVCSRDTARRALRLLEGAGWIVCQERGGTTGRRYETSRWVPGPEWDAPSPSSKPGDSKMQPPVVGVAAAPLRGGNPAAEGVATLPPKDQSGSRSDSGVNLTNAAHSRSAPLAPSGGSRAGGDTSDRQISATPDWAKVLVEVGADLKGEDLASAASELAHRTIGKVVRSPKAYVRSCAKNRRVTVSGLAEELMRGWERRTNIYRCDKCGERGEIAIEGALCGSCEGEAAALAKRRADEIAAQEAHQERAAQKRAEREAQERAKREERETRNQLRAASEDTAWAEHRQWERVKRERAESPAHMENAVRTALSLRWQFGAYERGRRDELQKAREHDGMVAWSEHLQWETQDLGEWVDQRKREDAARLADEIQQWWTDKDPQGAFREILRATSQSK